MENSGEIHNRGEMATFRTEPVEEFYQIGEDIGSGQFSEVKRVTEKSSGKDYAGKFIRKRRSVASRRGVKREDIVREVNILRELSHDHIISLHEGFETQKEVILILELVAGGELFHYLAEEDQVSEEVAAKFVKKILDGLKHMHDRNICHLDLKPENIMLLNRNTQNIMLIDFGLSRRIMPDEEKRAMIGTAEFVAPEVINYEPLSLSTDMWAIGVITYILLSGLSPFLGDDQQETYENVTALNYSYDEDYFSSTTDLAKDFIDRLLIKDPRKRATVDQCLSHPWIKPRSTKQRVQRQTSHLNMQNLRRFNARKRWKQSMKVVSICNKLSKNARLRSASTAVDVNGDPMPLAPSVSMTTDEEFEKGEYGEEGEIEVDGRERGVDDQGDTVGGGYAKEKSMSGDGVGEKVSELSALEGIRQEGSSREGGASKEENEATTKRGGATKEENKATTKRGGASKEENEATTKRGGASKDENEATTKRGGACNEEGKATTKKGGASTEEGVVTSIQGGASSEQGVDVQPTTVEFNALSGGKYHHNSSIDFSGSLVTKGKSSDKNVLISQRVGGGSPELRTEVGTPLKVERKVDIDEILKFAAAVMVVCAYFLYTQF